MDLLTCEVGLCLEHWPDTLHDISNQSRDFSEKCVSDKSPSLVSVIMFYIVQSLQLSARVIVDDLLTYLIIILAATSVSNPVFTETEKPGNPEFFQNRKTGFGLPLNPVFRF